MTRWRREEIVGLPLVETIVPPQYRAAHLAGLRRFLETGEGAVLNRRIQLTALHRDGQEFPVEITIRPIRRDDGNWIFAAFVHDISARHQTEREMEEQRKELERSNAELQQFAYVASHDLQEPLRMVASYTQLLAKRYEGKLGPDADEFIHYAVDGARRMQTLINDLLTYSRVGTRERPFEPTDCGEITRLALANLRVVIEESGAAVEVGQMPTVVADRTQMGQLLQNLIGNAIKFRDPDREPRIVVQAERNEHDRSWRFSVADNGIGIPPEHHERIFTIFQRLHSREEYPGTGIGLAIGRKIVERHGGALWVESQPGQGSTFLFTIPDHDDAEGADATSGTGAPS
jgi:PAS domain S-box-containing protein